MSPSKLRLVENLEKVFFLIVVFQIIFFLYHPILPCLNIIGAEEKVSLSFQAFSVCNLKSLLMLCWDQNKSIMDWHLLAYSSDYLGSIDAASFLPIQHISCLILVSGSFSSFNEVPKHWNWVKFIFENTARIFFYIAHFLSTSFQELFKRATSQSFD